jgi:NADP-reducing hydrogenase subunit HndD
MKQIKIKINNQEFVASPEESIMAVAMRNGIKIPGLCGHPDFKVKANCRLCIVEIKGRKKLATSCSVMAEDGMEVITENERIKKLRTTNLELLFSEHIEKCPTCVWRFQCPLLSMAEIYKVKITRFKDRKNNRKKYSFTNAVEVDGSQCIDCRNCIDACAMQGINYLELKGKGTNQEVVPTKNKKAHCILCGQCAVHCPVSAAQEQTHWEAVEKEIKNKKKIVVAQFAPSIRVSIGEDFGLPYGKIMTEHVVSGLKALGFNYVFDVNFAADLTTIIEAEELLERIKNKGKLPMFTSCCPAWINYVELYRPDLIPNITTSRSPQIHGGGFIKTYWAKKMNISPKDIVVVSIMPCTAKKYEASRKEMKINGLLPVDYVLTTREFSFMMKKNKINFSQLQPAIADDPFGKYTGGAAIFGGSGGVMESALRTAQFFAFGDNKVCKFQIDFKDVRGLAGVKEAMVDVAGNKLRIAIVNGIGNVKPILDNLKNYDYIEVMSCPGGCIGGGGQPIPTTPEIRQKRIDALYQIDKSCELRQSFENKGVMEMVEWAKQQGKSTEHKILHTSYKKRK